MVGVRARPRPAQQGVQAGLELAQVEGLGQVVVGTHVQAQHPVRHVGAGGEDQHRHRVAAFAQRLQHAQAVLPGQLQVEQHGIEPVTRLQAAVRLQAIGGEFDRHAALAQRRAEPQRNVARVLDQQDPGLKGIH